MDKVERVILAQNEDTFQKAGYTTIQQWQVVKAPARRRHYRYDHAQKDLSAFIASRSDIDDLVPVLVALQIEWNKLHNKLAHVSSTQLTEPSDESKPKDHYKELAELLDLPPKELLRLRKVWGNDFCNILRSMQKKRMDLRIQLLNGSLVQYWRATRIWWDEVQQQIPQVASRPIYFISSNTHVFPNLLTGYAQNNQQEILRILTDAHDHAMLAEWSSVTKANRGIENFLYYAFKKAQQYANDDQLEKDFIRQVENSGITRILSAQSFDVEAQVIELDKINYADMDQRLITSDTEVLQDSDALIINIDYPLGIAAYNLLRMIAENTEEILGIYIMGKAATLNGVIGDIMIPNVVQDEHSLNTYLFQNTFVASDLTPYLQFGTVLDNQKAVTVLGTFMQNSRIMDVIYREGYTDIEMEAGPYLSAVCEMVRPKRHPKNEIVNLYQLPFDLGILHYASDTPLSKGKNLGAGTLSLAGMDPTYGSGIAILRRIFEKEIQRLKNS
ncbi:MAG TPA: hypothetical protein ENN32_07080 [Chloroflexi bacterium]|nr:hypothetical protein [Chloroflexota bacterium]